MLGCLDCMHVFWKNCPIAWQGQFSGKASMPSIVLEAFGDFNLFVWHAAFGWAGSMNDINIWDRSPLLQSFLDGSFSEQVDFTFQIGDSNFNKLWLLVDGIYPEIARFVKTCAVPIGRMQQVYSAWQESARKDIEHVFGVLQHKFHILTRPIELHKLSEIQQVVESCIILHNWMVSERIARDEPETINWYEPALEIENEDEDHIDADREAFERRRAEIVLNNHLFEMFYEGSALNYEARYQKERDLLMPAHAQLVQYRWNKLYDGQEFHRLRGAIMKEVHSNYIKRHLGHHDDNTSL